MNITKEKTRVEIELNFDTRQNLKIGFDSTKNEKTGEKG